MTAHPNAHILAQLAEIAKTDPEPWKRLERYGTEGWVICNDITPVLNPDVVFRIKPATVNIGGVELEGPLRVAPSNGTPIWLLFDPTWERDDPLLFGRMLVLHRQCLEEGRLFATKEARDKYQDALVKLANGETK